MLASAILIWRRRAAPAIVWCGTQRIRSGTPYPMTVPLAPSGSSNSSPAPTWGPPYLLYLGDAHDELAIKTARGLAFWRPQWCLGQFRGPACQARLDLPELGFAAARAAGANSMVV